MMTRLRIPRLLAAYTVLLAGAAVAAPYVPTSDAAVLEHLPFRSGGNAERMARAMQTLLARDTNNLDIALRLAQLDVDRARIESDPRQLGHAQATLAPWWKEAEPPVPVVLLRATILQSTHQFGPARADLEQVVRRQPGNAQAWLTLATVQQVTGDLDGARASCVHVSAVSTTALGSICTASLDGVTGHAADALASIDQLLVRPAAFGDSIRVRTWATTLAGELAERLGRRTVAGQDYRSSLALDPKDAYTIATYADFLLDEGRPADVVSLIPLDTPVDVLLLRRAQADRALGSDDAPKSRQELIDRFAALRARGDRVHLREEARFTLAILDQPAAALDLALANWAVQKEPLDARIALECAIAAQRPQAVDDVVRSISSTGLEGARIAALTAQAQTR